MMQSSAEGHLHRFQIRLAGLLAFGEDASQQRRYFAREGHYASIDELRNAHDISMARDNRGPYVYTASTSENGFRITATYTGPAGEAQSSYSIDENMEVH